MTSHELWLGAVFVSGGIVKHIGEAAAKWAWGVFVHSSQATIKIWWSHKKAHAERTIEESMRHIGGSMP